MHQWWTYQWLHIFEQTLIRHICSAYVCYVDEMKQHLLNVWHITAWNSAINKCPMSLQAYVRLMEVDFTMLISIIEIGIVEHPHKRVNFEQILWHYQ